MEVQPKLAPLLTPQRVNEFIYQIKVFKEKTTPYCPMLVLITQKRALVKIHQTLHSCHKSYFYPR